VPPRAVAPPRAARTSERFVIAAIAALLAWVAYRGVLVYGFSQDDFSSLARAQGLLPRMHGPWRILANQWFWDLGLRAFGLDATAFHATVLAAHVACAALLAWLLSRRFPASAALVGAALWAIHPSIRTALYWTSANSEPFMTLFLLAATAAYFSAHRAARWAAVPAFLVALAWKESALLFPLALTALALLGPPPRREGRELARDPVLWALAAVALGWALAILPFVRHLSETSIAYAPGSGSIARNLLTYAAWTPSWMGWVQRDLSDSVLPKFVSAGAIVLLAALALLLWRPWRERGAAGALLAAIALLAPVLPLSSHTYRYYLLAPLAALSVAGAALFAAASARLPARARSIAAAAVVAAFAISSFTLLQLIENAPFRLPGSHADGTLDRALIATTAIADVKSASLPAHARLRLWSPELHAMEARTPSGPRETYEEVNVRAALLDGLALRVGVPALDSVRFVRSYQPGDTLAWWGIFRWDGHVRVFAGPQLARLVAAQSR
jgi:hypothetical protein